jgi:Golgi nucleoside diphosphatase
MIDAGSSGCRAHVFRYGVLGTPEGPLYVLPKHDSKKVRPGLSSFENEPVSAGISLTGLVDFMKEQIPQDKWAVTPIYLKATAGLRMLPKETSDLIIQSVQEFLSSSHNSPFYFEPKQASIIPGTEEGAYSWISVNYLKKVIGPFRPLGQINKDNAFAVVEMGGASTQVTQIASTYADQKAIENGYSYDFSIQGERFVLYAHSYLGYGGDQARVRFNEYLKTRRASAPKPSSQLMDPCLNSGYMRDKGHTGKSPYDGPDGDFYVVGGGDSSDKSCHEHLESALFAKRHGMLADCKEEPNFVSFDCVHQPPYVRKSKNILIFENFFYAASGLAVNPKGHNEEEIATSATFPLHTSPKEYLDSARDVCGMSWDRVEHGLPKDAQPREQNTKWCFSATYSYLFLTHGMGLHDDQSVLVQQTVGRSDIEWAIGAAYKEISDVLGPTYLRGY